MQWFLALQNASSFSLPLVRPRVFIQTVFLSEKVLQHLPDIGYGLNLRRTEDLEMALQANGLPGCCGT